MKNIFILGSSNDPIVNSLADIQNIELPTIYKDEDIHDFIEKQFKDVNIERLIISLTREDLDLQLRIAFHIRLSITLWSKRLIPIIFTSLSTLNSILNNAGLMGNIMFTSGCRFIFFDKEVLKRAVSKVKPLLKDQYKTKFLNSIVLHPNEKIGRHSLANQWGALRLNEVANLSVSKSNDELKIAQKQLYFKFMMAQISDLSYLNEKGIKVIGELPSTGHPDQIDIKDYNVLFIDDEADKGWSAVLRRILKKKNEEQLKVVNRKIDNYDSLPDDIRQLIENDFFDLYLIDLRLKGEEEENVVNPLDFSGCKLLKKIKSLNTGNQVLMFTASSKAWNMKTLLDLGADGYYIKESPEYNFPLSFSKENYMNLKKEINDSFNLSFLKKIVKRQSIIIEKIDLKYNSVSQECKSFYDRTKLTFSITLDLLKKSLTSNKYYNYTFLAYYQILEDFSNQSENFECIDSECKVNGVLVVEKTANNKKLKWKLKYYKDLVNGSYFKIEDCEASKGQPINSLARLSFIFAEKFQKDDVFLRKWASLNKLRNDKAAHGNSKEVDELNLFEMLELVDVII